MALALGVGLASALFLGYAAREAGAQTATAGKVFAWGDNNFGQLAVPDEAKSGVKVIAAGGYHSLALKEDGSVVVWGRDNYGQTTQIPDNAKTGVKAIAGGLEHSLVLKDNGSVIVWGYDGYNLSTVPAGAGSGVKAIASGWNHALAVKEDGSVVAWGDDYYGQSSVPSGLSGVQAVAGGKEHSLALKEDGSVIAWGDKYNQRQQTVVPSSARAGVEAISAGRWHSLALKTDATPPAAVGSFANVVDPAGGRVSLSWKNPTDVDFTAVRVLRSTDGFYASGPEPNADQTLVYEGTAESFTDTGLTNGTSYKYTAYAYDGKNFSEWATTLATPYDTTLPDTTLANSGPTGVVAATSAAFGFTSTEAGSTFECSLDDEPFEPCDPQKTYGDFADGFHVFEARAVDAAGTKDPTPVRRTWSVDTAAPNTGITEGPSGTVKSATAAFEFLASEPGATFRCSLDGAAFAACDPPERLTGLSDGPHTFLVEATDAAGNADATPAGRTWSVDAAVPGGPEITSPANDSSDKDGAFVVEGTAEGGSTVRLYEGATRVGMDEADPESGAWRIPLSGVSDGGHTYTAKATDAADNSSAASASVTVLVDSAAPSVVRVDPRNGAKGVAPLANLTVTFSEAMRPTTVSKATVKLVSSGRVVPAKVTYGVEAKTATLNPDARLVAGTTYRAVVSTGAEDAAGNPLRAAEGWRFSAKP